MGEHVRAFRGLIQFSTFCLISYLAGEIEFDEEGIITHINKVKEYVSFEFSAEKFLLEVTHAVNLMYKDGDKYLFTHRSFQEYFSAYAVINFFQNKMVDLVPRINRGSDMVLGLMYEMNRVIVDENYIIPEYEKFKKELEEVLRERTPKDLFAKVGARYVAGFSVEKGTLRLSMIGTDIVAGSWAYVNHLRAFFDSYTEIRELNRLERFDSSVIKEMQKCVSRLIKDSPPGSYIIAVYDIHSRTIKYSLKDREDFDSLEEDIDNAVQGENSVSARSAKFSIAVERDGQAIKSLYVATEKVLRQTKRAYIRKEKSIDELLT